MLDERVDDLRLRVGGEAGQQTEIVVPPQRPFVEQGLEVADVADALPGVHLLRRRGGENRERHWRHPPAVVAGLAGVRVDPDEAGDALERDDARWLFEKKRSGARRPA